MFRPLCLAIFLLITPAMAQDVAQDGSQTGTPPNMAQVEQAWARGDFVFVRKGLAYLAQENGSALAQYRYGRVLLEGRGGPADPESAKLWLEKAVAQNNADAATLLGQILLTRGPARDATRAATLFEAAAARGKTQAQYFLGRLYAKGDGVPMDATTAFNWFLAAAEDGNKDAQYALSQAYAEGRGVAQSAPDALRWLEEAASNGVPDAQYNLAVAYDTGRGANKSATAALDNYRRAAEAGHVLAQRALGTKYLQGTQDFDPNPTEALRWLQAAAQAGDPGAMSNLGFGYTQGTVLPRDDALAAQWYQRASDRGLARATLALARMVETGRGVQADRAGSFALYQLAVEQGSTLAAQLLGQRTLAGDFDATLAPHDAVGWVAVLLDGDQSDAAQVWLTTQADAGVRPAQAALGQWLLTQESRATDAIRWLERAALAGHVPSQYRLGDAYSTGAGAPLDYVQAHAWMNIAAASGHIKARETRSLLNDLMTPDDVAKAQTIAREFFERADAQVPQTSQTVTQSDTK
ncbi:hypothetical protein [Ascidiaceihabitans sp.]|uniref:tetratricopeptide repeat protein n=1 Tax=Ascidiaceihabitans sp. TaxID=1872644 RepID=UPI00329A2B58